MKILTMCDGNACRSQIAAEYLKRLHPDWEIYSAGVTPCKEIHWKTRAVGWEIGLEFLSNPTHWKTYLSDDFYLVVCFSEESYNEVKEKWNSIYLPVDDPTPEGNREKFIKTRDEIVQKMNELVI